MDNEFIVRLLTIGSLAGLLLAVGMKLSIEQVLEALRKRRLTLIVIANFAIVPAIVLAVTEFYGFRTEISIGMILLAAAPFAPVVPVFARMAQADLALAAGLTALFPLLSVFLIPLICRMALKAIAFPGAVQFDVSEALILMLATIVLPLGFGIAVNHVALVFARKRVRQVEIFSEMAGAASLAFATANGMAGHTLHWLAAIGGDGGRGRDILAAGLFAGWTGSRFTASDWIRHE
jgi:bile acid:Na+ symporter, BASS family